MQHLWLPLPGWLGAAFAGICCLGAGPVLASAATASGLGVLAGIFNIYVLGPLVTVSVAWSLWSMWRLARRRGTQPVRYPPMWLTLAGSPLLIAGVFLPVLAAGTRPLASALIYIGLAGLVAGAVWSLVDRRRLRRHEPTAA